MGIVCGLHLVDDAIIEHFFENPNVSERDFYDNYVNPDGRFHDEGENFFYLDKAWDIAAFLISENDASKEKVLYNFLDGNPFENSDGLSYIKSENVIVMNEIISKISSQQIEEAYNEPKMQNPYVYNAGFFTKEDSWDYILDHVNTICKAFKKADENAKGIIIYKG